MDKKIVSYVLIALSVVAAILAGADYLSKGSELAPLGLGADSWGVVATVFGIYAIYVKSL